jgi:hypothetical protein
VKVNCWELAAAEIIKAFDIPYPYDRSLRVCLVCRLPYTSGRSFTCSDKCHKMLVEVLDEKVKR